MLRRALSLSIATAVLCGGGEALAARTTTTVAGSVRAVAFSGDALTIARLPADGGLTVERRPPGGAPHVLLGTSLRSDDDEIVLASSAQATAVGLRADGGESLGPSRVFAGPADGPLRDVASCPTGVLAPPVAVLGARIAWREGGCGEPGDDPTGITPASIAIGAADPAVAPVRLALDAGLLPVSLTLADSGGMVGALRPSFFAVDSEVRGFSQLGIGATLAGERGRIVAPVGVLADGTRVFSLAKLVSGDETQGGGGCPNSLFTIGPGATQRRALELGGCPLAADAPDGPAGVRVAGDRVFALVVATPREAAVHPPQTSLVSARGDGGDRRVHAQGSYRAPLGLAADGDRAAFWQQRCAGGGSDVVVVDGVREDAGPAPIASCRAQVLTTTARPRDGVIAVRLRCSSGCGGVAVEVGGEIGRPLRTFSFERGTHALRLRLPRAVRRSGRLFLRLAVDGGPERSAVIRLRH